MERDQEVELNDETKEILEFEWLHDRQYIYAKHPDRGMRMVADGRSNIFREHHEAVELLKELDGLNELLEEAGVHPSLLGKIRRVHEDLNTLVRKTPFLRIRGFSYGLDQPTILNHIVRLHNSHGKVVELLQDVLSEDMVTNQTLQGNKRRDQAQELLAELLQADTERDMS